MAAIFTPVGRRARTAPAYEPTKRSRPRKPKPVQTVASMAAIMDDLGAPAGQRIVCAWPPKQLNPNSRMHPARRSPFAKKYRHDCWALALEARLSVAAEGRIPVRLDFFPPDRVRRDDGIADAMRVDDSRFDVTAHLHTHPLGCVVVTLLDPLREANR